MTPNSQDDWRYVPLILMNIRLAEDESADLGHIFSYGSFCARDDEEIEMLSSSQL